jgi:excisionase family DNA binding protein
MTIKEAAEYLGVSVKTLERRIALGDISVAYVPSTTGRQRTFDRAELDRFKQAEAEKMVATTYVARPRVAPVASGAPDSQALLQRTNHGPNSGALLELLTAIEQARAAHPPALTVSDLAHKLTLSLVEASQLSGLSRNHLRAAIEAKKLKARIIGRGWKVKKIDLESYVAKL